MAGHAEKNLEKLPTKLRIAAIVGSNIIFSPAEKFIHFFLGSSYHPSSKDKEFSDNSYHYWTCQGVWKVETESGSEHLKKKSFFLKRKTWEEISSVSRQFQFPAPLFRSWREIESECFIRALRSLSFATASSSSSCLLCSSFSLRVPQQSHRTGQEAGQPA